MGSERHINILKNYMDIKSILTINQCLLIALYCYCYCYCIRIDSIRSDWIGLVEFKRIQYKLSNETHRTSELTDDFDVDSLKWNPLVEMTMMFRQSAV